MKAITIDATESDVKLMEYVDRVNLVVRNVEQDENLVAVVTLRMTNRGSHGFESVERFYWQDEMLFRLWYDEEEGHHYVDVKRMTRNEAEEFIEMLVKQFGKDGQ